MMQLFVIALVVGLFAHDGRLADPGSAAAAAEGALHGWALAAWYVLPKLALMGAFAMVVRRTMKRLDQGKGGVALRRLDRFTFIYRVAVLATYGLDLKFGVLMTIRRAVGDMVLLDELAVMLPPLALMAWGWSQAYHVDRRLREAAMIRHLDAGEPMQPICSQTQYVVSQIRHQVLLLLGPMLVILAWTELLNLQTWISLSGGESALLSLLGVAVVFVMSPLLIRAMWDTTPVPPGALRTMLLDLCKRHRVGVREVLIWRTFGSMINAAVMGLFAPLRFILLTDALLETMDTGEVEAVMAHEVAHVRRHHMVWMLVSAGGLMMMLSLGGELSLALAYPNHGGMAQANISMGAKGAAGVTGYAGSATHFSAGSMPLATGWSPPAVYPTGGIRLGGQVISRDIVEGAVAMLVGGGWILGFGWMSRRFERQADAFAVVHLASRQAEAEGLDGPVVIGASSIEAMAGALGKVGSLNHVALTRRSWRHGSIAWRQAYLRQLLGHRADRLTIDRVMVGIHIAGLLMILLAGGLFWLLSRLHTMSM